MNKKTTSIIIGLFLIVSCQEDVNPYSISEEQLVELMADIHISEAATAQLSVAIRDSMSEVYLEQILAIHQVDRGEFESNFNKLKKDPKNLQAIYTKVISRLNQLKLPKKDKANERNKVNEKEKGK